MSCILVICCNSYVQGIWFVILIGVYFLQVKNKPWLPWVYTWIWHHHEQGLSNILTQNLDNFLFKKTILHLKRFLRKKLFFIKKWTKLPALTVPSTRQLYTLHQGVLHAPPGSSTPSSRLFLPPLVFSTPYKSVFYTLYLRFLTLHQRGLPVL